MPSEEARLVKDETADQVRCVLRVGRIEWNVRTQMFDYIPPLRSEWEHWKDYGWRLEGPFR